MIHSRLSALSLPPLEGAILTLFVEFVRNSKSSNNTSAAFREFCRREIELSDDDVVEQIGEKFDRLKKRIDFHLLQTSRLATG